MLAGFELTPTAPLDDHRQRRRGLSDPGNAEARSPGSAGQSRSIRPHYRSPSKGVIRHRDRCRCGAAARGNRRRPAHAYVAARIFEQARPVSECATRMFCVGCIALASGGEPGRHVGACEGPRAALSVHGCFVESRSELSGRGPIWAIPGRRWDPKSPRRGTTGWLSAAGRLRWRDTFASPRGCRPRRSPSVWVARWQRSRRTSTIPPARTHERSSPGTSACAPGCAPTLSRAGAGGSWCADEQGFGWRPGPRWLPPAELRPAPWRPGLASTEAWERFDEAVEALSRARTGLSVVAIAQAFAQLSLAAWGLGEGSTRGAASARPSGWATSVSLRASPGRRAWA